MKTNEVKVNGMDCRVWEKGSGDAVFYLPGIGGLPSWTLFLDNLAENFRVIAPSPPGYPGGGSGHFKLDTQLDWILAIRDLLHEAGMTRHDLIATSATASLAAEIAALWPEMVNKLVLIGPMGLFEDKDPVANPFCQRPGTIGQVLCHDPDNYTRLTSRPPEESEEEWPIVLNRVNEAIARFSWPFCDNGLSKRLHRIEAPTLLIRGDNDQILPATYVSRFQQGLSAQVSTSTIPAAGHLAELDQPDEVARVTSSFLLS